MAKVLGNGGKSKSRNAKQNGVVAISANQPNSYPVPHQPLTLTGERLPSTEQSSDPDKQRKENILQVARERFKVASEAENSRRAEFKEDLDFSVGKQWDTSVEIVRRQQRRPCLTINRLPGFIKRVVNNMRQERPAIKVDPVGNGADEEMAQVRQGLIRHIETASDADICYDTAFENMCVMGLGWMRVVDDWSAPDSFEKDLFIRSIPNTFSVYSDPFAIMPDWSDMQWAFITEDLTREEFIEQYGDEFIVAGRADFSGLGDMGPYWFPGGKIRVAEYFRIEHEKGTLCEMPDGTTKQWSELKDMTVEGESGPEPIYQLIDDPETGDEVILSIEGYRGRTRPCITPRVKWAKISALDILRERDWKGRHIPLIPIVGNQTDLDGDKYVRGMVRFAREPQRMYNYMYSSFVEMVAMVPKAPYVAEIDQIPDGLMEMWQNANSMPQGVLTYKHKVSDTGDHLLPAPQRIQAEPPIQAFVAGLQMCDANLKAVFSIYEASLGQRGPQESGLAINARKVESDTATFDWGDNFIRGLRYLGQILDDLLQYYYNSPGRIIQITREDQTKRKVVMNQEFSEGEEVKKFDLSASGQYAKVISTGPDLPTRRKDAVFHMMELTKVYPALMQAAGDLIVRQMDFPDKDSIADRLKAMNPVAVDEDSMEGLPPKARATVQQALQQVQALTQELTKATDENTRQRMKEEYATLREQMKQEVNLAVAELKVGSSDAQFLTSQLLQELQEIRALVTPQTVGNGSAGAAPAAPPPSAPTAAPILDGQTVGPEPSVGGSTAPGNGAQ